MQGKKKYRLKPISYLLLLLLIVLIIFIIVPKNHEKKYSINDYNIIEMFNNKNKRYNLSISKDDKIFEYNFDSKNIGKKIIKSIDNVSNDEYSCIIIDIKNNNKIPLCHDIDYHLIESIDFSQFKKEYNNNSKTVDNTYVYNTLGKTYFVWNYNNFSYISDKETSKIELFKSDNYNINISTTIKDYLIIANYDELYNFKELILINMKNKSKDTWQLNHEISFESYVLGTVDNYIYIVDKKNKTQYRLDIKRKEMKVVGTDTNGGITYNKGKYEDVTMYKLINNEVEFDYGYDQKYIIDNDKLYLKTENTKILVSNNNISKIIYQNNNYVYYLVGDTLYYHSVLDGEVLIMKNFEWNFNNNNVIFIY